MAFRQARNANVVVVTSFVLGKATKVGQTIQLIDQVEVVRTTPTDRFEMVCQAGSTIHDADILEATVPAWCFVDNMTYLWGTCRLKAVSCHAQLQPGQFEFVVDETSVQAEADIDGIYVIRSSVEAEQLESDDVVYGYKLPTNSRPPTRSSVP